MSTRTKQRRKGKKSTTRSQYMKVPNLSRLGFPDCLRTTLTYSDVIAINPASAVGQYTFRGNSVFDPDYTSAGHQPYYRDQLAAPYARYRVYSSKIHVSAVNEQVATALQVTIIPSSDVITFTGSTYPLEYPYARPLRMLGVGGIMTAAGTHSMSTQELLGLRPREVLDQDYSASIGSQPSSEWYWLIVAQDLSAENIQTSMQVRITYDVEFYDRATVSPSFAVPSPPAPPTLRGAAKFGASHTGPTLSVRPPDSGRRG